MSPATVQQPEINLGEMLAQFAKECGAVHHLLFSAQVHGRRTLLEVLSASWVYDAVLQAQSRFLPTLIEQDAISLPGQAPLILSASTSPHAALIETSPALSRHIGDYCCVQLLAGKERFLLLLSADTGGMDDYLVQIAQMKSSYLLSSIKATLPQDRSAILSDRERECLRWVSEGKTTEDIALIVSVSANTVNNYLSNAMQKLSASNRPMAIATAIRANLI